MTDNADTDDVNQTPRSWLLFRPREIFMTLPVPQRWEFTRRHPYYLQFWRLARAHHDQASSSDPQLQRAQDAAVLILSCIGVSESTCPPDPRLPANALDVEGLRDPWIGGAVAPATLRALAIMLMLSLPAARRLELGRLFNESAEYESAESDGMRGIISRLALLREPDWDTYHANVPVISINLERPQRAILEAVGELVQQWKNDRSIPEHRRRDDRLDDYLAAWDAREGWADGEYHPTHERTFREIAQETGEGFSTIVGRYRSAFRYLTGHDYNPDLWIRLMGPLKLSCFCGAEAGQGLVRRRPWRSPNLRPVTESVLLPGRAEYDQPGFLADAGITDDNIELVDLAMDIQTLIDRGRSDTEILNELEIPARFVDLVGEIRRRHDGQ